MSWIAERLLVLASPLFAAAATGKKKTATKPAKRSVTRGKSARARTRQPEKAPTRATRRAATRGKTAEATSAPRPAGARDKTTVPAVPAAPVHPAAPTGSAPRPVAPTARAILLAPQNGKFADSIYPQFRWLSVGGATRYEVAWSEDPNFAGAYSVISIATEAAVPLEKPLRPEVTYYWRVRGGNEAGWGPWSPAASFRVLEGASP